MESRVGGGEWGRLGGVKVIAILTDFKREEAEVVWKQEINCWGVLIQVCLYLNLESVCVWL